MFHLNVRADSFTLHAGLHEDAGAQVMSFDLEGRPLTWFREGTLYKRSLASDWLARRPGARGRERWSLTQAEAAGLMRDWHAQVVQAQAELKNPLLDAALAWTPERLQAEKVRYAAAYAPVSILPPDQYYAVVVQVTRGCSWNRCSFCTFYRDRPFTVHSREAFDLHLKAVHDLLGRGATLRKNVFIADGNALMLANSKLLPLLDAARAAFPDRPLHGFLDVFTGSRKTVRDWAELRRAGVRRVYLGLETGHDHLLHWLSKPGDAEQATRLVHDLKEAGLNVGTIFMTGVGGRQYAGKHVQDTLNLLERLPLGTGDLVYLSPFVEHGEYLLNAARDGIRPLTSLEKDEQERLFRAHLAEVHPGVKAARYDIREFLY